MPRSRALITLALVVLVIELGATLGSLLGEPFDPVAGWAPTRAVDGLAFALVVVGCGALGFLGRFPRVAAALATGAYCAFALGDYEMGMFLAPMVAVFVLVAMHRQLLTAGICALSSLGAGLIWVATRLAPVTEPGVILLAWVAFGVVLATFFLLPFLLGEITGLRRQLRWAPGSSAINHARGPESREGARNSVPSG